jgi:hypothetical protein
MGQVSADTLDPELIFLDTLTKENGYLGARPIPRTWQGKPMYACVMPLAFTAAIIAGRMGDFSSYEDRWCYHSIGDALAALLAWDGHGEPTGWHRHPGTGRRRPEGDPAQEYINP